MNEFSALDQHNLYAPVGLLIQLAFLIAGIWFARNVLRTMRAFQEQVGAILKLSITDVTGERHLSSASAKRPLSEGSQYWLAPPETETAGLPDPEESGPSRFAVARRRIVQWLQAPMSRTETAPWRRIVTWLQAPTGS
jgi:hypothetical protein